MGNHGVGHSCTMPEDYYEHYAAFNTRAVDGGLTHMVPSVVDNGRQRIMVFEGNEDIRADLLSWLQTRQTNSILVRRTIRATARDADEGDGTSSEQSPASEDTPISPPLGNEGVVSAFSPPLCKDEQKRYHNGF
jgi:hypothetical protein